MSDLREIALSTLDVALDAAPWLFIGMIAAGLVRAVVPTNIVSRWLGGRGVLSVVRASVVGIPLPLCSCGVLPTAVGLRRQGAGRPATVSFLVSTPEIGVDSFALSYALLGPVMAITRPIAAFISAVVAGLAAMAVDRRGDTVEPATEPQSDCCSSTDEPATKLPLRQRLIEGQRYVFTRLLDDISKWLVVAIVVAGVVMTYFGGGDLAGVGSGLGAMLVMLVVGVPLYLCATASTPVAASLLLAGVSPGAVLVLLLAGPATNIGSIGVLRRELGVRVLTAYLGAIAVCSLGAGLALDWIISITGLSVVAQAQHAHEHTIFPDWFAWVALTVLVIAGLRPLWRWVGRALGGEQRTGEASCCATDSPDAPTDAPTDDTPGETPDADPAASFRV